MNILLTLVVLATPQLHYASLTFSSASEARAKIIELFGSMWDISLMTNAIVNAYGDQKIFIQGIDVDRLMSESGIAPVCDICFALDSDTQAGHYMCEVCHRLNFTAIERDSYQSASSWFAEEFRMCQVDHREAGDEFDCDGCTNYMIEDARREDDKWAAYIDQRDRAAV